jgi:hypothetical protein
VVRSREGVRNPLSVVSGDIDRPRRSVGAVSCPLAGSVQDYTSRRSEVGLVRPVMSQRSQGEHGA